MANLQELTTEWGDSLTSGIGFVSLATLLNDGPVVRSMGSWAISGSTLDSSTSRTSDEVNQSVKGPRVSVRLLVEGQKLPKLRSSVLSGAAKLLDEEDRARAIAAVGARSRRFRDRADEGQLGDAAIDAVKSTQEQRVDFSKSVVPGALTVFGAP